MNKSSDKGSTDLEGKLQALKKPMMKSFDSGASHGNQNGSHKRYKSTGSSNFSN